MQRPNKLREGSPEAPMHRFASVDESRPILISAKGHKRKRPTAGLDIRVALESRNAHAP